MKKLEEILTWLFVVAIVLIAIVVLIGSVAEYRACQEVGGVLARGLFGFECVDRR
jgi:uncharacterized membrane protein